MSLKAPTGSPKGNFVPQENIEPGAYPARLVQIISLGLQPQRPFKGQEKPPANELMFTYELVDTFMKDEDGNDIEDKPRWISETFPLRSLAAENARSTERYLAFDPEKIYEGDFAQLIGQPVNVIIVNNASGDKVYDNVGNVTAMRAKDAAKCPPLVNPTKVFDLDDPDMEVFNALPQWIRDKIKGNLHFKGSTLEKLVAAGGEKAKEAPANKAPKAAAKAEANADDQDDAPY